MQPHDLSSIPSLDDPLPSFPNSSSTMSDDRSSSSPIHYDNEKDNKSTHNVNKINSSSNNNDDVICNNNTLRRERPSRACTDRSAARLYAAAAAEAAITATERKRKAAARRERVATAAAKEEEEDVNESEEEQEDSRLPSTRTQKQGGKIVTSLVGEPEPSQLPRWSIRSMWELASILNFLNIFRPILNIKVEFSVEEFETALLTPNNTLADIHMPLLKVIPPITRIALGHNTWVTVLCRKLRDWWQWVAEGELPIVVSHGAEFDAYNALDPGVRVVILKALCDIRVEQEDIRNYIDDSLKTGYHLSTFRKERIGGDSHGISYWYEDDPMIGHRLYRERRKMEVKKGKGKTVPPISSSCYQWETVATNLDEFQDVSDKLFSSKSRIEASVGKKLKNDMLPEIERVHKRKENLLKKQHRQALLLDSIMGMDGLSSGRSLRDRKPVTYTFDDYERSINEAIKITKCKQPSPEPTAQKEAVRNAFSTNGKWGGPSQMINHVYFKMSSLKSHDYDETDENLKPGPLERSNQRRQRPQRYSAKEFVEAVSDNDVDLDSDDDIVGEAVYDEEYLRRRKQRRIMSSSSEGDEEYQWDEYNAEEEEEEEEEDDSLSLSEDSNEPQRFKKLPGRTRRETKLRSVDELQSGLRRSKRATRNHINYSQYVMSESENESLKPVKSNVSDEHAYASDNSVFSTESQDFEANDNKQEIKVDEPVQEHPETVEKEQIQPGKLNSPSHDEFEIPRRRRFLDLNELAPGSGFEDGPNSMLKDEDKDEF